MAASNSTVTADPNRPISLTRQFATREEVTNAIIERLEQATAICLDAQTDDDAPELAALAAARRCIQEAITLTIALHEQDQALGGGPAA